MAEIARKTPTTLREFMDRVDGFINAEDMLEALIAPWQSEMERAGQKASDGNQLGLTVSCSNATQGLHGDVIQLMRAITLLVLAGKAPKTEAIMSDFLVVKSPSSYNAILACPTLNSLRAVTSTYHLKMKFPTDSGVGEVRGEQVLAQECYDRELRHEALRQADPNEPLELVAVDQSTLEWMVQIGTKLDPKMRTGLISLLIEHRDVFAWSYEDMPEIDNSIIEHWLGVDLAVRRVKQKRQSISAERYWAIVEEVECLLLVGFIQQVHYPEWLFNVVLVKKANGKWRMCVDFTDLNKACPTVSLYLAST
ncbi:hypothetical protein F2P56_011221 [Juglans regia]|uniref:Uncharacterized protein LOC108986031 n=2 Tax=Juglans regia TaxID=51240 RepID=A0A2I4E3U2_JUGRE|nr:uncharacterized protein LOC108986031 [Juglans regia]KAF5470724.1 hypothetical protein F2P56_011221 [Juglans regia]